MTGRDEGLEAYSADSWSLLRGNGEEMDMLACEVKRVVGVAPECIR